MKEREFSVDGQTYRAGRISTFDQLNVASQWREALMGLAMAKKNRPAGMADEAYRETVAIVLTGALARVETRQREEVTQLLASVVRRKGQGGKTGAGWFQVVAPGGAMAFDDLRFPQLVSILYEVLDHNGLLDFFSVGPSASEEGPETETGDAGQGSPVARIG